MQLHQQTTVAMLWNSHDEQRWRSAVDHYQINPTVRRVMEIEQVRNYDASEWYEFLQKYFEWKFAGNYLPQKLGYLEQTGLKKLFAAKTALFELDEFGMENIRKCLNTVRSPHIKVCSTQAPLACWRFSFQSTLPWRIDS